MARKGRQDRGLRARRNAAGKTVWYVRVGIGSGNEIERGPFKDKTSGRKFYQKCKTEQAEDRFNPDRSRSGGHQVFEEMLARYLATATLKKDAKSERYFARWWGQRFAKQLVKDITPEMLEDVRQSLLAKGLTPQRVNRYYQWLRKVLNAEVRLGRLLKNPVLNLKMFREPKGRTRFLSPEEEAKVMAALDPKYRPWVRLAILTGMRQAEQFSLRWEDVDFAHGVLTLPVTKAGGVQYVRLNEEAKSILRGMDGGKYAVGLFPDFQYGQRPVWVFPSQNLRTHLDPRHFYARIWMPAVRKAGIEWATWHDLRHTYASRLAMNGQTEGTIATLMRQSSTALVKRYAHLSPSYLQNAVEEVSRFGKTTRKEGLVDLEPPKPLANRDGTGTASKPDTVDVL